MAPRSCSPTTRTPTASPSPRRAPTGLRRAQRQRDRTAARRLDGASTSGRATRRQGGNAELRCRAARWRRWQRPRASTGRRRSRGSSGCARAPPSSATKFAVLLAFEGCRRCRRRRRQRQGRPLPARCLAEMAGWLRRELNRLGGRAPRRIGRDARPPRRRRELHGHLPRPRPPPRSSNVAPDGPGGYWSAVGGDTILGVRDRARVDTDVEGGTPKLPTSKSSHMITYRLASAPSSRCAAPAPSRRSSGTPRWWRR